MISSCNGCYVFELSDESGMTFVDFVTNAELTVFVVSHSIDLTFGCENKSVENSTFDLLGFL